MKKIGIYDPYMHILGGGERYVLVIAECLSSDGDVALFSDNPDLLDHVKTKFGMIVKNTTVRPWPKNRHERDQALSQFDLFFYVTDGSLFTSASKKNILIIQSPAHIPPLSLVNRFKIRSWKTIFCYSEFMAYIIKKRLGKTAHPLFVPISDQIQEKTDKKNMILSVGRFFQQLHNKKQLEMVEVFEEMVKEGTHTTLTLVGSIDPGGEAYLEKVKEASKKLPVKIINNATSEELQKLYAQAKIYWHATGFGENLVNYPEKAEHFGVTTIEAMAHGCVPIVFNGGGQPEIVTHKKTGFLWHTKEEIKKYTREILSDETLRQKLATSVQETAKSYRQEFFCKKLKQIISE